LRSSLEVFVFWTGARTETGTVSRRDSRAVRERRRWRAVVLLSVGLRGARARQSAEAARARARADRDDAAKWRRIVAGGIHLTITRVAPHAERRARRTSCGNLSLSGAYLATGRVRV
jgi:hypothetical protein